MDYIIGVIVLILIFIIWGYFFKKRYFKEIDRLESWKISITHRPVLEELSKVKQLNMTGETEEMFENWRIEWDAIITDHMPEVEELLFDAEEFVDKYRFSRSKEIQRKITVKLNEIEEMIKKILYELNELVGSEEKNRLEIEDIKESYRQLKKSLLAHRHNYGKAADKLESSLDEVLQILQKYEEETGERQLFECEGACSHPLRKNWRFCQLKWKCSLNYWWIANPSCIPSLMN